MHNRWPMTHYREVRVPTRADIEAASKRLAGIRMASAGRPCRTPLVRSSWLSERLRCDVWIKIESVQPGGSFKIRGALNVLHQLHIERPDVSTVVTASAGNHGAAMAIAARHFGVRLRVHLPATAPEAKRQGLLSQGAELVEASDYDGAESAARRDAEESGAPYISPYNHPDVIAGAGTVALEMLEDQPALTSIVVPLGGGGLLAGAAIVAREHPHAVRVIGAEAEHSPVFTTALAAGAITPVEVHDTLADGLAGNLEPGSQTFDLVRDLVDAVALVSESSIETAMRNLVYRERLISEGAGATGVAALLQGGLGLDGGPVGVMLSGRNIDMTVLKRVL
jgi:threonine dehydratase